MTGLAGAWVEANLMSALAIVPDDQQAARQYALALCVKAEQYHQVADRHSHKKFAIVESKPATLFHGVSIKSHSDSCCAVCIHLTLPRRILRIKHNDAYHSFLADYSASKPCRTP